MTLGERELGAVPPGGAETGGIVRRQDHFRRPAERPFTRAERPRVTILFGGLTACHDSLIMAAVAGLGYRIARIPTPTKADYQTGREYGNPGMCNPAYFTLGALVNYLKRLHDRDGLTRREILDQYVFVTAGSDGPCRFGMYEAEYRRGLRNAGFDGFRVILFQQTGGLLQSHEDAGFELDARFALALLNALMAADALNDLAYQIRPYEIEEGQTDRVFGAVLEEVSAALGSWAAHDTRGGLGSRFVARLAGIPDADAVQKMLDQLLGGPLVSVLEQCGQRINEAIEVDYTRPKPACKIIGEAWAQMTEGDGNFRMFSFLESQGAEVTVEPVMNWVNYLMHSTRCRIAEQKRVWERMPSAARELSSRVGGILRHQKDLLLIGLAGKLVNREFERLRRALGGLGHPLADQATLQRLAEPFYNHKISGGEGHLEVGKTIYYSVNKLAHLVVSLKPFGCMPSTQSDGTQAAVMARYPDVFFIPIETSGEGDINAYSRVQMGLGDAKTRCKQEFDACVARTGYSLQEIRAYCASHRALRRPLQPAPRCSGVIGRAANFVLHVASCMDAETGLRTGRGKVRQEAARQVTR